MVFIVVVMNALSDEVWLQNNADPAKWLLIGGELSSFVLDLMPLTLLECVYYNLLECKCIITCWSVFGLGN